MKDNLRIMEENLDNQQKPEPQSQGPVNTPASSQAAGQPQGAPQQTGQKKPYRRYYGNRNFYNCNN